MNISVDLAHAVSLGVKINFEKLLLLKYLFTHAQDSSVEKVLYNNDVYYAFQYQSIGKNVVGISVKRQDVLGKSLKTLADLGLLKAHPRKSGVKLYTFTSIALAVLGYTHVDSVELEVPVSSGKKKIDQPWYSEDNPKVKWWDYIPQSLRSSEIFIEAWIKWDNFRRTEKKAPLTPTSVKQQLKKMEKYGVEVSIKTIESSIDNGYQGLFFDKFNGNGRQQFTKTKPIIPDGEAFAQFQ